MAKTKRQKHATSATQQGKQASQQRQGTLSRNGGATPNKTKSEKVRKRTTFRLNPWLLIIGIVAVIAGIVSIFVVINNSSNTNTEIATPTDATTFKQVTQVDPDRLAQTGTGGITTPFQLPKNAPPLLVGPTGKPEIFYYGAEYCPFCAAERWPVIIAMSRFGTFSKLTETLSSSTDVYPNTATFTFAKSSYSSSYVDFVPVESLDRQQQLLQTPAASDQQLITTYDTTNNIPFMDIANKYFVVSPSYDVGMLRTNPKNATSQPLSQQEIASQLATGNDLSKGILGSANYLTAAICTSTDNKPSTVCNTPAIQQIESSLAKTSVTSSRGEQFAHVPSLDMGTRREDDFFMQ